MTTSPDGTIEAAILVLDIYQSAAIHDALRGEGESGRWSDLLTAFDKAMTKHSAAAGFENYKFLGDGWIFIFPENATTGKNVRETLLWVDRLYKTAFAKRVSPLLPKIAPPEISFGATEGRLSTFKMNRRSEYIGKAINEACRLQSVAAMKNVGSGSRGYVSTDFYEKFQTDFDRKISPHALSMRNVAGGDTLRCYPLYVSSCE